MKTFRLWCQDMWYAHCDEVESYTRTQPDYMAKEYFAQYKWFLKREYQYAKKNDLFQLRPLTFTQNSV